MMKCVSPENSALSCSGGGAIPYRDLASCEIFICVSADVESPRRSLWPAEVAWVL